MAMIFLIAFYLSEVLLVTLATNASNPIWADETRLGKYQNASKILNQTDVYYLAKSTFNTAEYLWGNNFNCVSVRRIHDISEGIKSEFNFTNEQNGTKMNTLTLKTTLFNTSNYNISNAIQYQLHNCSFLNDTVIFTDGDTCDLVSIPYENDGWGCELWVKQGYLRNKTTPLCCYFLFDLLCADKGNYDIYNEKCPDWEKNGAGMPIE